MNLGDLTPHGFCLAWDPGLIWLHAGSDLLITLAYYSIPAALIVFLRRREDLAFKPVFVLFAAFILACGTGHLLNIVTLWFPVYWLDGAVKAVTAILSVATAAMLWPLMPKALAIPSAAHLRLLNTRLEYEVSERTAAVANLEASRVRQLQLYARTPAILHATDAGGILLNVSDRWLDLFGYTRDEVLGRKITDFYAPEVRPAVEAHITALNEGRGALSSERIIQCKSGEQRAAAGVYELEYDDEANLQRILVALTDVTAHRRAEHALSVSEERLRHAQKMEAVGQLTGGIAHDFNNLLTTIMGSLELLERDVSGAAMNNPAQSAKSAAPGAQATRARRLIANALEGSHRAARLTSQLLTFSRRQRLAPVTLAPAAVVDGIRDMLARSLGETVTLTISPREPGQWQVLADRNQLEVALLNLIINARDAMPGAPGRAGQVTITFANRHLTAADIEDLTPDTIVSGDYVAITVTDNGHGMSADVLQHAFEPFFTTKPAGAGTGLGLPQTYGFASQSGGTVNIKSRPGLGTRVEILLPRSITDLADTTALPKLPAIGAGRGETILYSEDDRLLRATVTEALEHQGYTVIGAPDAEHALAILQSRTDIALLFTDVMMPGAMTGVALAQAARALHPNLRIIFATGYSDRRVLDAWPETLDLLAKPFSLEELATRIAAALRPPDSVLAQ